MTFNRHTTDHHFPPDLDALRASTSKKINAQEDPLVVRLVRALGHIDANGSDPKAARDAFMVWLMSLPADLTNGRAAAEAAEMCAEIARSPNQRAFLQCLEEAARFDAATQMAHARRRNRRRSQ